MTESRTPLSSGTDHGTGADNTGNCNCIQCRLTALFKKISVLHVVGDDADALLGVMDGMYAIIRDTGMVYRVLPCPALVKAMQELEEHAVALAGMQAGYELRKTVGRLKQIIPVEVQRGI